MSQSTNDHHGLSRHFSAQRRSRRSLQMEHLEDRRLLAVVGVDPVVSPTNPEFYEFLDAISSPPEGAISYIQPVRYSAFELDRPAFESFVSGAPLEFTDAASQTSYQLSIPAPDGSLQSFEIVSAPVMAPELAAEFPEIMTFRGQGLDDAAASLRFDLTPQGFHAQVLSPNGTYYIDPYYHLDQSVYVSYWRSDFALDPEVQRLRDESLLPDDMLAWNGPDGDHDHDGGGTVLERTGDTLRTYRLAVAATGEYTAFHGGTVSAGQAAIVTAVNRVTGVYEVELTVRMVLVPNNSSLVYTNAATDPYTNNNGSVMLGQNQATIDSIIGNANYDIGHVFSTGGGGIAGLAVVGRTGVKARGVTGLFSPIGDPFYIDYVAHEMGHQYGGDHTFNGSLGSCGPARSGSSAYEPGSGSTIMAYAGICGSDNLQNNSDPYFHSRSLDQILSYLDNSVPFAGTRTSTGNNQPLADAGSNYTIPADTPFRLVGSGSDPDSGDVLSYNWEERDLGPQQSLTQPDNGTSPIIRSFTATTSNTRTVPRLPNLLSNTFAKGEKLPSTTRTLRFRLSVRDNRPGAGGVDTDDMQISVVDTGAPFQVTSPNSSSAAWSVGNTETVTWNTAGTSGGTINTPLVNILLSTDGGQTFPTVLASNVPNDGSHDVVVPNTTTTQARVMVEGVGNIFFDVSNFNFQIAEIDTTPPDASATTSDVMSAGDATYSFTVTYSDNVAVDSSDIGNGDVEIIAPDLSVIPVLFVSKTTSLDTSPITATYLITPPGGTWDDSDNGIYTVRSVAGEVTDTSENPLAAMDIGTFLVDIPPLGGSCDNPAPAGIPGDGFADLIYSPVSGVLSYRVDGTSLPADGILEFHITGPQPLGPAAGAPTFGTSNYTSGTQNLTMPVTGGTPGLERDLPLLQYPTGLVLEDFDCSQYVTVGSGSAVTTYTTVAVSGDNAPIVFSTPSDVTVAGGTNHTFDVILVDDIGIEVSDLTTGVFRVSGPNGYDEVATVLSVLPPVNSTAVNVAVSIPAAGGTWDVNDQGIYSVIVEPYAITDVNNNFFPGGVVGTFTVNISGTVQGDFDQDGDLDCDDIDALTTAISTGSTDLTFDVTGDSQVNSADLDEWILNLKGTLFGDANLDLRVDGSDFNIWNGAKFVAGTAWCSGDFNADGRTDGSDFGIWNSNKFQGGQALARTVPTTGPTTVIPSSCHEIASDLTADSAPREGKLRPPAAVRERAEDARIRLAGPAGPIGSAAQTRATARGGDRETIERGSWRPVDAVFALWN